ncbi:MAG: hypothetical protein EOP61_00210 [Sphingomonadales bacterium]|nr:MAG: hypothetical protein EOP61_00210 [Sphingomonadales bacterium]
MRDPHGRRMKMLAKPLLCACLAAMVPAPAASRLPHATLQDGQAKPGVSVREIERRVIPRMPGAQYLGFDYDPSSNIYTLKFLRNGSVIWVDVDGRTGNIVRSSGN